MKMIESDRVLASSPAEIFIYLFEHTLLKQRHTCADCAFNTLQKKICIKNNVQK